MKVISNPKPLSLNYVPEKVIYRESEISALLNSMEITNTFLFGPSGTGKTLILKKAIEEFNSINKKAIYIDCSLYQTTNAIFQEILFSLGSIISSKSNYDLTKRLRSKISHLGIKVVACLDHFEYLKEIETLNRLLSLGIGLVIVAQTKDALKRLDRRVRSTITNTIEVKSYTDEQTFEILLNRAQEALVEYSYSEDTIRKIAEVSKGNISFALNLLKTLAIKAETEGKESIDNLELDIEPDCTHENLSEDERILLEILRENKVLPAGKLFDLYLQKANFPKSERSFRNYMRRLCVKGFVKSVGKKRGRFYEIIQKE